MASPSVYLIALLAGRAAAWPGEISLLQPEGRGSTSEYLSVLEGGSALVPDDAPTWCKNETQLTWVQRKERMQQHNTLQWAKKMVEQLQSVPNATIPEWMDKLVSEDNKRGNMKWAVQESKRLKAEGKETPQWMEDLVADDTKWANRWAACKSAQLQMISEEVPTWMAENARKGVMEAATEKAEELQEQIEELDEQRDQEVAVVSAQGDVALANVRMLARSRVILTSTLSQQTRVLEQDLDELDRAEAVARSEGADLIAAARELRHSLRKATSAAHLMTKMLDRKMTMAKALGA